MLKSSIHDRLQRRISLANLTTLQAGGEAEYFFEAKGAADLAEIGDWCREFERKFVVLGWGSNVLASDLGVPGVVVLNRNRDILIEDNGSVTCGSGAMLQDLFLKCTIAGLSGLEFAVGIPGTVGGALVSNAGAYRNSISAHLTRLTIWHEGKVQSVEPSWLSLSYRDSRLRNTPGEQTIILSATFHFPIGNRWQGYLMAKEFQRQRILKQPKPGSAGSFFKNVQSVPLAAFLPDLPEPLKESGVIPAAFLIEKAGLKGIRRGRAAFSSRHANFLINLGQATAAELRDLTEIVRQKVHSVFGVELEPEVLLLGDWSGYSSPTE